ncbi:MAG: Mrp/NBP35 family ATP-binding protein [Acidimicrobiia bacterium]|nr:Mrp/NBP35 family ATP-binding protein [Acidimicrobiia bacterium]MDH3462203.1 Mrp/NBP35 family ATP-binding protein [Acidimicrobiia bacterium]
MVTRDDVLKALEGVRDPELGGNVVELGMISDVSIDGGHVEVGLALTIAECPLRNQIESDTNRRVASLPGVDEVTVRTTAMTKKQRANLMSVARSQARAKAEPTQVAPTTRVIAFGSGKGGVGKSSISVNVAVSLAAAGFRIGLLDADIWGFSIPRMLGVDDRLEASDDTKLIQPATAHGVKVVSTGLIIDSEETALMWRGLMLSKALEQFLQQVEWGELDYLVIDLPPGTGDVQMALSRMLPQAEMVVVTTPQRAAQKVAIRAADMARRSHMPIVGVIENMSGFECSCSEVHQLFGEGGGEELASDLGVPLIARIPLDPHVVPGGDHGRPVAIDQPQSAAGSALVGAAEKLIALIPPAQMETCTGRIAKMLMDLESQPA